MERNTSTPQAARLFRVSGHQHPDVIAAIGRQANKLTYAHTSFFTTDVAEDLADKLVAGAPKGIRMFISSLAFRSHGDVAQDGSSIFY